MPDHANHEQSILDHARRIDSEKSRYEYLANICGVDSELLERIQKQLQSDAKKSTDLDNPTFTQTPPVSLIETGEFLDRNENSVDNSLSGNQRGAMIAGRYELLELIAEGGMGSVWLAQQSEPVKRKVAIKLIKAGMDSHQVLARFEAERQALAVMDHPNIAKVFDGGLTEQDRPYFAMEYVQGAPLTQFCDEEKLSITDRLKLFITICRAIQHAHHKGIIHRDLKPANILVSSPDGQPVAKVIDFGLAKAMDQSLTDHSLLTMHGMILGTPLYMSPEQAESGKLDIDTRSDVYSLGVILFELLTGTTPLKRKQAKRASAPELLKLIKESDPPKPSTRISGSDGLASIAEHRSIESGRLKRRIAGDLDWVVMKALERDRDRRYETANGLAGDIQRHLDHEPVSAGPPTTGYRVTKFVRKHRGLVTALLTILILLVSGIIGVSGFAIQANREAARARRAEGLAGDRLIQARELQQLAETNEAAAVQQSQLAMSTLTSIIYDFQKSLKELPGAGDIRRRLLSTSIEKLKSVSTDFVSQASIDRNTMVAISKLGETVMRFGSDDEMQSMGGGDANKSVFELSELFFLQADRIGKKLIKENPNDVHLQFDVFNNIHKLGDLYHRSGRNAKAQEAYENGLNVSLAIARIAPGHEFARLSQAISYSNLGMISETVGDNSKATQSFQVALDQFEILAESDVTCHHDLAVCHDRIGRLKIKEGKTIEALANFQQALESAQKLVIAEPSNRGWQSSLAKAFDNISTAKMQLGRHDDGMKALGKSMLIRQKLAEDDPNDLRAVNALAQAHRKMGWNYFRIGELEHAETHILTALKRFEFLVAELPDDNAMQRRLSIVLMFLGDIHASHDKRESALQNYQRGVAISEQLAELEPESIRRLDDLEIGYGKLGTFHLEGRSMEAARDMYQKAQQICEKLLATDPQNWLRRRSLALAHLNLGNLYFDKNENDKALNAYLKFVTIYRSLMNDDRDNAHAISEFTVGHVQLGELYSRLGDLKKAEAAYRESLDAVKNLDQRGMLEPHMRQFIDTLAQKIKALEPE